MTKGYAAQPACRQADEESASEAVEKVVTALMGVRRARFPAERCPDCEGTGYRWMGEEFTLCICMADQLPAYDFTRHAKGEVRLIIGMSRRHRNGQADVWMPCQHCIIGPIKGGPYSGGDVIRVPWVPDCQKHRPANSQPSPGISTASTTST